MPFAPSLPPRRPATRGSKSKTKIVSAIDGTKTRLFKTELCRMYAETGKCRYGLGCRFAHSEQQLQPVDRHPKYKTQPCANYWADGYCPYGQRCCFIHMRNQTPTLINQLVADREGLWPRLQDSGVIGMTQRSLCDAFVDKVMFDQKDGLLDLQLGSKIGEFGEELKVTEAVVDEDIHAIWEEIAKEVDAEKVLYEKQASCTEVDDQVAKDIVGEGQGDAIAAIGRALCDEQERGTLNITNRSSDSCLSAEDKDFKYLKNLVDRYVASPEPAIYHPLKSRALFACSTGQTAPVFQSDDASDELTADDLSDYAVEEDTDACDWPFQEKDVVSMVLESFGGPLHNAWDGKFGKGGIAPIGTGRLGGVKSAGFTRAEDNLIAALSGYQHSLGRKTETSNEMEESDAEEPAKACEETRQDSKYSPNASPSPVSATKALLPTAIFIENAMKKVIKDSVVDLGEEEEIVDFHHVEGLRSKRLSVFKSLALG